MEYKNCGKPKIIYKNTLFNCDCMELLKETPDKYFELAIVDPPYGIDWHRTGFKQQDHLYEKYKKEFDKWDKKPNKEYWGELIRVSKNQIICGINYFSEFYGNFTPIVWDKKNGGSMMADGELFGTSIKTSLKIWRHAYIGKYHFDPIRIHPTQKPVALYKWLLKNYAKEGDKILDTHLGSGSIAIACHYMGFELTGCELDKEYFGSAVERISNQTRQETLL